MLYGKKFIRLVNLEDFSLVWQWLEVLVVLCCLMLSWFTVCIRWPKDYPTPALGFGFQTSRLNIDRHRLSRADSFKQKSLDAESKECQTCHLFDFDQSWHCALAQWCLSRVVFNGVESRFHHVLLFFFFEARPRYSIGKMQQDFARLLFSKKTPVQHHRFGMQTWFRSLGGWLLLALPHWRISLRIHLREVLCQLQRCSSFLAKHEKPIPGGYCHLLPFVAICCQWSALYLQCPCITN